MSSHVVQPAPHTHKNNGMSSSGRSVSSRKQRIQELEERLRATTQQYSAKPTTQQYSAVTSMSESNNQEDAAAAAVAAAAAAAVAAVARGAAAAVNHDSVTALKKIDAAVDWWDQLDGDQRFELEEAVKQVLASPAQSPTRSKSEGESKSLYSQSTTICGSASSGEEAEASYMSASTSPQSKTVRSEYTSQASSESGTDTSEADNIDSESESEEGDDEYTDNQDNNSRSYEDEGEGEYDEEEEGQYEEAEYDEDGSDDDSEDSYDDDNSTIYTTLSLLEAAIQDETLNRKLVLENMPQITNVQAVLNKGKTEALELEEQQALIDVINALLMDVQSRKEDPPTAPPQGASSSADSFKVILPPWLDTDKNKSSQKKVVANVPDAAKKEVTMNISNTTNGREPLLPPWFSESQRKCAEEEQPQALVEKQQGESSERQPRRRTIELDVSVNTKPLVVAVDADAVQDKVQPTQQQQLPTASSEVSKIQQKKKNPVVDKPKSILKGEPQSHSDLDGSLHRGVPVRKSALTTNQDKQSVPVAQKTPKKPSAPTRTKKTKKKKATTTSTTKLVPIAENEQVTDVASPTTKAASAVSSGDSYWDHHIPSGNRPEEPRGGGRSFFGWKKSNSERKLVDTKNDKNKNRESKKKQRERNAVIRANVQSLLYTQGTAEGAFLRTQQQQKSSSLGVSKHQQRLDQINAAWQQQYNADGTCKSTNSTSNNSGGTMDSTLTDHSWSETYHSTMRDSDDSSDEEDVRIIFNSSAHFWVYKVNNSRTSCKKSSVMYLCGRIEASVITLFRKIITKESTVSLSPVYDMNWRPVRSGQSILAPSSS